MPMRARMSVRPGMAKVTAVIFVCLLAIFAVPVVHAGHVPDPDLNNDGVVDHADLEIIKGSVGKRCGESGFNELADINHDCLVDLFDLVFVARAFGQSGFPTEEQDTTPPVVTITAPPDQSLLNATPIAVSGTVDDDTATVTVNGVQATVSAGTFTAAGVPLQRGVNTLTATATDPAANVGTASIQVTLDTTAPQVTIASPVDGSTLNTNTPLIRITYADPAGAGLDLQSLVVQINGVDQTSLFTKGATEATAQLTSATPLAEGPNTIQAQINDQAGNAASATATVTVITVPVTPAGFGVVLGQVVDATTGQPLAGTTVKALGSTSTVLTDAQGRFQLPAPAGNRAPIYFNKGGYIDAKFFATVEDGRETNVGTVRLQPFDQVATRIDSNGGSHTDSTGTVQVIFPAGA
ncbi:MAG: carboxypeptidase-like regulatory domain-containing protein, partial [candidate division NC10 bacterium]